MNSVASSRQTVLSRRDLLKSLGALIVVVPAAAYSGNTVAQQAQPVTALGLGGWRPPDPTELDSWLAIGKDGRVTAFFGKPDSGQGVNTAIAQIVAEELDVPCGSVEIIQADTALTCDQFGISGSTAIQNGAVPLRNAAAEARAILLQRAAARLDAPVERLRVEGGVVSVIGDSQRQISYGQLAATRFEHRLEWNGVYGNTLIVSGTAKPKRPDQYTLVGTSVPRRDVPRKIFGEFEYVADLKRPNMLYGRPIRPEVAGARPVSVDESSIAHIAGAKVVRKGDFIGVVAPTEWDVVQASRAVKVTWSQSPEPFVPNSHLYDYLRKAEPTQRQVVQVVGNVYPSFGRGGRLVQAEYEWPFQGHASMAPACAVAEATPEGITVWHSSQKPYANSAGVAAMLGLPTEKVRSIFTTGPGSYGRNDAGDAAADAALMSTLTGRPVRVQGSRSDATGWDPKSTPSVHRARAVVGEDGRLEAYEFMSRGFPAMEVGTAENEPHDLLAGMLLGFETPRPDFFGVPQDAYDVPNRQMGWEVVQNFLAYASPLRTSNLRDPLGPQLHFASESFIDECALAAGADPIEFRLQHLKDPRHIAVVKAVAEKARWTPGPPGSRRGLRGETMTGRGFAYTPRVDTLVAMIVDVEVERATGRVWPRRFVVAHDCGLIVNPQGLRQCIECNVVQSTSRALFEEVKFDRRNVTSVDWISYPILDITDAPEAVDVVLIDRPEQPAAGAGEPSSRPTAAAIANAIFDATGLRLRRVPFTPDRVKAALARQA